MHRTVLALFLFAGPLLAQGGFFGSNKEAKTSFPLTDPLTGEVFQQPIPRETEIVWTDRLQRPIAIGEHPRLRALWVSPFTGFATYRNPDLWNRIGKSGSVDKPALRKRLAKLHRYRHVRAFPALDRYALAVETYSALRMLGEELRVRLYLDAAWCARDGGNEKAEAHYLALLRPILEKRAENESITAVQMIGAGYLAGEIARLQGDEKAAQRLLTQADSRIKRWKEGRQYRVYARLGMAEFAWKDKSDDELKAMLEAPDPWDAHVAALLLVDRGAGAALAPLLKGKKLGLKKDLVHRIYENPKAALLGALTPALTDDDSHVASWAARAMGRMNTDTAVKTLVKMLREESEERLVEGLNEARSDKATAALAKLAEEGTGFGGRPLAARALLARPGSLAAKGLVQHVAVAESYNLGSAVQTGLKYGPGLLPELRKALEAETDATRLANLLQFAAAAGDRPSAEIAARYLGSADERVTLNAALVTAAAGENKAAVLAALPGATSANRVPLIVALGYLGEGRALEAEWTDKARQQNYPAFLAALRAAGRARGVPARKRLVALLADADPVVAASAAHGLILMGDKSRVLPRLPSAPYVEVAAIARGLGEAGDAGDVKALIEAYEAADYAWLGSLPGGAGYYRLPKEEILLALKKLGGKNAQAFLKKVRG